MDFQCWAIWAPQGSKRKRIYNYELWDLFFNVFMDKIFIFYFYYFAVPALKSCIIWMWDFLNWKVLIFGSNPGTQVLGCKCKSRRPLRHVLLYLFCDFKCWLYSYLEWIWYELTKIRHILQETNFFVILVYKKYIWVHKLHWQVFGFFWPPIL